MSRMNCSLLKVSLGAMLFVSIDCFASEIEQPFSFNVGVGKAKHQQMVDIAGLTSRGYIVKSYQANKVYEQSNSIGVAYSVSKKISFSANWQSFGRVHSTLDVELPEGKTAKQAAEEIVSASPQQVGGFMVALGGNYIQPVYSRFDMRIGAGFLFGKDKHQVTINNENFDIDDSLSAPYLKFGVGVKLARGFTVTANAERYFLDDAIKRYEIGLSYSY